MTNIHFASIEMNDRDEPIFIAADIEHNLVAGFICGRKSSAHFTEIAKGGAPHDFEPARQRQFAVRVLFPKLAQSLSRDDVHAPIISQSEILRKLALKEPV